MILLCSEWGLLRNKGKSLIKRLRMISQIDKAAVLYTPLGDGGNNEIQMDTNELTEGLNKDLAIALPEKISYEELQRLLAEHINHLIKNDFEKLVGYLYRIDVNEQKLKGLLHQYSDEDAGKIISLLIIERQEQKIKSRQQFSQRDNDISEDEKW